jgi:hypothetical protein
VLFTSEELLEYKANAGIEAAHRRVRKVRVGNRKRS